MADEEKTPIAVQYPGYSGAPPPSEAPPPAYVPAAAGSPPGMVVVTQPSIVYRDRPVALPNGQFTELKYRNGLLSYLLCLVTCLMLGGVLLCCIGLIFLCIPVLQDVDHIDPSTGRVVGTYKRIG